MKGLVSLYSFQYARALVYMLQSVEYRAAPFLRWFWRAPDFRRVMYRRMLDMTAAAKMLLLALRTGMALQLLAGIGLVAAWLLDGRTALGWPAWQLGVALILTYPMVWAHLIVLPLLIGRALIVMPRQRAAVARSERIFANHDGIKLAIVGSYGKTSMKQLLQTVLSNPGNAAKKPARGLKVAVSPANRNVAISHAALASSLDGDEDVVLIEFGEGKPGDVARLAAQTHPTHAVITGLAPAHLDRYKTLQAAGKDIFSIVGFVPEGQVYGNVGSEATRNFMADTIQPTHRYDDQVALGWKIEAIKVTVEATSFVLRKGRKKLKIKSGLLGRHQIGPLAFAAIFALEMGLSEKHVVQAIATTSPVEHRMQPYRIGGPATASAWIIDDTYNGNLEGIKAGTALLAELPAKRKWYVTPGLVDQGRDTARIHVRVGELIAAARPDVVVLMENSVTAYIEAGLRAGGYAGRVRIEPDPLHFYTNLSYFVAAGDIVMMQNDWTDNYA